MRLILLERPSTMDSEIQLLSIVVQSSTILNHKTSEDSYRNLKNLIGHHPECCYLTHHTCNSKPHCLPSWMVRSVKAALSPTIPAIVAWGIDIMSVFLFCGWWIAEYRVTKLSLSLMSLWYYCVPNPPPPPSLPPFWLAAQELEMWITLGQSRSF